MALDRFTKFAWFVLIYNLLVVAWGVFVRVSKSGDGCGSHWPFCDGDHTPLMGDSARLVEASHRISTTLCGVLAIILLVWAFRKYPKGHAIRAGATTVFGLTLFEGLIGAALVKFGLVAMNDSAARAGIMAVHVNSTFFLVGAILFTALVAGGAPVWSWRKPTGDPLRLMLVVGFLLLMFLGVSGAISALGHQLAPSNDVLSNAMNPATFWMARLQPFHPMLAILIGLYLGFVAVYAARTRPDPGVRVAAQTLVGLYLFQCALGLASIWLKAPIPMQMTHLVVADLNFLSLVALSLYALNPALQPVRSSQGLSVGQEVAV